jgi:hypothetical protein
MLLAKIRLSHMQYVPHRNKTQEAPSISHSKMRRQLQLPRMLFLLLSLLLLLLLLLPHHVSSFAAWLKCYVDLDDTEVVMNHQILLPEQALHSVEIEVKLLASDSGSGSGSGSDESESESDWSTAGLTYPASRPSTVQARLRIPPELERRDIQYVMETTEGGVFHPAAMCEGSRSHASSRKHVLVLEVSGEEESVELWAGWATGHEAVTMTPRIVLHRAGGGGKSPTTVDAEL